MINLTLNKKVIIFGFIFTFFSSFGQSFFLGLFNAPIRNELGITHGQFGNIYATATIFSSLLLIWVGKKIDEYQIIYYSFFVIFFMSYLCVWSTVPQYSLHGKVIARSLMKCHVSVLIAQQHFFFFRRFFLLSKLSVSALFFP